MENVDISNLDLGSIDFTPDWAKKDAGVVVGKTTPAREFEDKKSFDSTRQNSERKSFDRKGGQDRKGSFKKPFERRANFVPRPKPLSVDIKILPDPKALGTIIRKLQQDSHAYKLRDLAYFFLDNLSSVLLKVSPKKDENGASEPLKFHQCKICGFASTNEADVVAHAVQCHLGEYYESKEVECEPPKGNFNCVAKCGLSGVLLGPPNIHEFNATVRETLRSRYPGMSEDEYRSNIVMVRDSDAIEQWRQSATKKTIFVAKNAGENVRELNREQAESEFKRLILPQLLDIPKNLMISADIALKSPVKPLQWAVRDAIEMERRSPYNMCFALRGAFHHRKMHFFRANDARGPEFVTGIELKEFDSTHAIAELAKIADFVAANPCMTKAEIAPDAESEKQLQWLVSTGHIVAFTNGVYSAVEKFPKYGPQWRKKKVKVQGEGEGEVKIDTAPAAEPVATPAEEVKAETVLENKEEEKKDEAPTQLAE
ncbi:MAG: hypothetical protein J6Q84_04220 [Kiritimatiellae bacterium]|nr:hypothetical protein [Kiritimatiellia bacterium]